MFQSCNSAEATEKITRWEKLHARTVAWIPTTWKGMLQNALRDCELTNKKDSNYTKLQVSACMIIISRKRTLNQLERRQIKTHKLYFARIGNLTFYGQ